MSSESVHCFGPDDILTGIYTAPKTPTEHPCVVFLNAGLLHRVGPYRMFVDLARDIADSGVAAFRFDLSGLGESMVRIDSVSERERVVADINEGLNFLERSYGHKRFVLVGLCSGADNAHWAALQDQRIVGALLMDGPGYVNLNYRIAHYLPRLFRASAWRSRLSQLFRRLTVAKTADAEQGQRMDLYERPFPPREQMEREIGVLAERGMKMLFMYTGGVSYYYNHASQFTENFPSIKLNQKGSNVQYEYHREFDHTYSNLQHRRYLFGRVKEWVLTAFGA